MTSSNTNYTNEGKVYKYYKNMNLTYGVENAYLKKTLTSGSDGYVLRTMDTGQNSSFNYVSKYWKITNASGAIYDSHDTIPRFCYLDREQDEIKI